MKLLRLPGLIDIHVHLRDPGEIQKEDFYTGTLSALAGGVTTVFDMPNNIVPIFSRKSLLEKLSVAKSKAVCDFGLYFGSIGDNISEFEKAAADVIGLKVYLSLTTGKYVLGDEDKLKIIFQNWPKQKIIVFHAERDRIDLVIRLMEKYGNKVHITHVTTKDGLEKIIAAKSDNLPLTCDVTPHHLFLTDTSGVIVKPALSTKKDQDFLWNNLKSIDCLVSDHAPHTISEKKSDKPPSGVPGVETMLPLMLTEVKKGRLSVNELIRLTSTSPRKIFNLPQDDSAYIEVDTAEEYIIENKSLFTKCAWSPYAGWQVAGRVKKVYLHRKLAFENGKLLVSQGFGNYLH